MKQKHEFKSIVAETLLIPLYMRAKESRRERPILNDKAAECLADSLEYDYSRFDGAKLSEVGCVVRGWYFDRAVRRFIGTHARLSKPCCSKNGPPISLTNSRTLRSKNQALGLDKFSLRAVPAGERHVV